MWSPATARITHEGEQTLAGLLPFAPEIIHGWSACAASNATVCLVPVLANLPLAHRPPWRVAEKRRAVSHPMTVAFAPRVGRSGWATCHMRRRVWTGSTRSPDPLRLR